MLAELLMELIHCWQRSSAEILRAEAAFLITKKFCEQVTHECWRTDFSSAAEEIDFFRRVQPQFCGRLMYYSILYEALVSAPSDPAQATAFWERESQRLLRFTQKNQVFIEYLDSGATDRDAIYFRRGDYLQPAFVHGKIYQCGPDDVTLPASLCCSLFAEQSYHAYVESRKQTFFLMS